MNNGGKMKRYRVKDDMAFVEEDGDFLSFNQVKEMMIKYAQEFSPFLFDDIIAEEYIKDFDAKRQVYS